MPLGAQRRLPSQSWSRKRDRRDATVRSSASADRNRSGLRHLTQSLGWVSVGIVLTQVLVWPLRRSAHRQLPALIPGGVLSGVSKDIAMEGKLLKYVGAVTLGSAVLISGPAVAQQSGGTQSAQTKTAQADNASGGQSSSSIEQRRDDEKKDWGWLGLIGLIGLAGLRRKRHDKDGRRDTVRGAA